MKGVKVTGPRVTFSRGQPKRRDRFPGRRREPQTQPQVIVVQQRRRLLRGPQPVQVQPTDVDEHSGWDYHGSTLWRNGRQLAPLAIPAALLATSGVLQMTVAFGADRRHLAVGALVVSALAALVFAKAASGRLADRWRPRVYAWALAGPTWLIATAAAGLSWVMVAALILATAAITSRWWAEHRRGYPTRPPRTPAPDKPDEDVPPAVDDIVGLFNRYAKVDGGPAQGCRLENPNVTDARKRYDMAIRPGQDSLNRMLQRIDLLAGAVLHDPEDVMLEKHPTRKGYLQFTVVTHSPVRETVAFTGHGWREDGLTAWIEAGTWADGDGRVSIPVLGPNSAWNAAFLATMGGGKTSLLNLLALSARASGRVVLWYLDGKGGASSPILRDYADWAPLGVTESEIRARGLQVLGALEKVAELRRRQMMIEGLSGITPTPERPLLILIIDECHVFFDGADKATVARWNKIIRLLRSLGILVWAATQFAKINSFGNESDLKEAICGRTVVAGKIRDANAKGLLRVQFDANQLPTGGGWWFIDAEQDRSAMWRSDFLDDTRSPGQHDSQADVEFQKLPTVPLEDAVLRGMPEFYTRRAELAAEAREALLRGDDGHAPAVPVRTPTGPSGGGWEPQWPTLRAVPTTPAVPAGLDGRLADVWTQVAAGHDTVKEISGALDLGSSQVYTYLTQLRDTGHVQPVDGARGRYEITS